MGSIASPKTTKRPIVLAAIILAMFMAAVEATIVATAMPGIVADLGGFSLFSWVFSSYLLMQVVMIPIYGKLSDLYGRKIIFSIGITIFLIGSILCGFSISMEMLIVSRFIQGMGAGAVQPIATTIVGDMYTKEERANIQGYLASVWGISSVIGPLLGGLFVEYIHWSWVFWLNVPFGVIALLGVMLFLHEQVEKKKRQIDYFGSVLLLISVTSLMFVLVQGGVTWPWRSGPILSLVVVFVLSLYYFIRQEKKAKEPIITLSLWSRRVILFANTASFTAGGIILAISSFLPTYVQGVMGQSAMIAGFTLTVVSIGWPIASTIAGKLMLKIGFRQTAMLGGVALLLGATIFVTLPMISHPIWAGVGSFFIGVGMGFATTTFIVSIQSSVDWEVRGEATSSNMFMRLLGGAVGVALLGGLLNSRLSSYLQVNGEGLSIPLDLDAANLLLDASLRSQLQEKEILVLQDGLAYALTSVYWGVLVLAFLSFLSIVMLPKDKR
ncbi:MDR family MFS transporter [Halalkalibacterium ligniniphilum]|uniref:MDR family MFS transporter n=1 Tax=Halalkalibacterium ligniniphilum TaxID=1134413 RepID=UPI0003455414|nr:MDR family MFS transporter [Halalkalibacterium ligniniphilum]